MAKKKTKVTKNNGSMGFKGRPTKKGKKDKK